MNLQKDLKKRIDAEKEFLRRNSARQHICYKCEKCEIAIFDSRKSRKFLKKYCPHCVEVTYFKRVVE